MSADGNGVSGAGMPLIHAEVYALAVAAICRLRRPILGRAGRLAVVLCNRHDLQSIPSNERLTPVDVFNRLEAAQRVGEPLNLIREGYPLVYGIVAAIIVVAALLARRRLPYLTW